jgi:hypothetical protein
VEHERDPLGGREKVQHDEERRTDGLRDHGFVLGSGQVDGGGRGVRGLHAGGVLGPRTPGPQPIEADAGGDGREPPAEVVDGSGIGPADAEPRLLDGVIGVLVRPEHAVGQRPQARPAGLELAAQAVTVIHRHDTMY